jgi:DNA-binding response OmpR family regulator
MAHPRCLHRGIENLWVRLLLCFSMPQFNDLAGAHVLVVEDEALLGMTLMALLEHHGATVAGPCASHRGATDAIAESRPHFAFLDINIASGTTFELAQWLGDQDIPFAFLTGEPADAVPVGLHPVGHLVKPAAGRDIVALALRMWSKPSPSLG